ncbi:decaprenyl-phosphate phosphoribosyltransferase [Lentzea sp. NPDC051208]|uniref:decaprenyl-phosphate phosphoribosyltransferase n=1 Tax=Lentzea sp. NPDC051208 TaxID=3154642 RepID=UPI00342A8C94
MTATETVAPPDSRTSPLHITGSLFAALRPRQWTKNVLVLAAPFAAGELGSVPVLTQSAVAFLAFALAASGIYLVNDIRDREADRQHPVKRDRPIAAGRVPVWLAATTAVVLLCAALGTAAWVALPLVGVLAVYEAVQLAYCFGLKHQPVIEMGIVASGFLLRAIAGGAATGIALSHWFLLVSGFGSLFVVAGKRYAEVVLVADTGREVRRVLDAYTHSYLRFVWITAASVMMSSYALWAFDIHEVSDSRLSVLSVVPFVLAVFCYGLDVDRGRAGAPEDAILVDRTLQVLGLLWVGCLGAALYLH